MFDGFFYFLVWQWVFQGHEIRRLSTSEYYTKAGYKETVKKIGEWKPENLAALENEITTNRSTIMPDIVACMASTLNALPTAAAFYDNPNVQILKFLNYQGQQKLNEEMVNIFTTGGKKYQNHRDPQNRSETETMPRRRRRRRPGGTTHELPPPELPPPELPTPELQPPELPVIGRTKS